MLQRYYLCVLCEKISVHSVVKLIQLCSHVNCKLQNRYKNSEIEHPKYEIKNYFCAVKNGIPYLSSPTHFTESTTAKPAQIHFFKFFSE